MNIQKTLCGPFHLHSEHTVELQLNWLVVDLFFLVLEMRGRNLASV